MLNQALHKTAGFARSLYDDFKEFLAPSSCLCCGRERDFPDPFLCPFCIENLKLKNIGNGPICPFCGRPRGTGSSCPRCSNPMLDLYFWGFYQEELQECLLQFKFHGAIDLGRKLTRMASEALDERSARNSYDLIIPVPLHKGRERERHFNQSALIANELGKALEIAVWPEALSRVKPTKQQAKLEEEERWNNVSGAFVVSHGLEGELVNRNILLVDDIVTTGATVYEASRPILACKPKRLDIFSIAYAK
jgi:competence protein ComFC